MLPNFRIAGIQSLSRLVLFVPDAEDHHFEILVSMMESGVIESSTVCEELPKNIGPPMMTGSLVVDLSGLLTQIGQEDEWFHDTISWLVDHRDIVNIPQGLRLDSNFFIATLINGGSFQVKEAYQVKSNAQQNFIGILERTGRLDREVQPKWVRRGDLKGVNVKVASVHLPYLSEMLPSGKDFTGFFPESFKVIQHMSNFSVEWVTPGDRMYGVQMENGSWSGLVGMLQRREVDVVAASLAFTLERRKVMSFSHFLFETKSTAIVANPAFLGRKGYIDFQSFLTVFTPATWAALVLMLIPLGIVYMGLFGRKGGRGSMLLAWLSFGYKTYLKLGIGDDYLKVPYKKAIRILFIVAPLYALVVSAHFDSVLTLFMSVPPPLSQINSFSDLVDFGYRVVTVKGSQFQTALELAPEGTSWHYVYHNAMKGRPDAFLPSVAVLEEALFADPGKVAIIGPQTSFVRDKRYPVSLLCIIFNEILDPATYLAFGCLSFQYLKVLFYCSKRRYLPLMHLPDAKAEMGSFGLQTDSEFEEFLNHQIIAMHSSGVVDFLNNKWLGGREPSDDICGSQQQEGAFPLGFENLFFPSSVFATGVAAAVAMALAEFLIKSFTGTNV